jgi:hypothetical protein
MTTQNINMPMAMELLKENNIEWTSLRVNRDENRIEWKVSSEGLEGFVINVGANRGVYLSDGSSVL